MPYEFDAEPATISTRAEWARALTDQRTRAGLTVRELAKRSDVRAGTLGDYLTGRHLPSVAQTSQFRGVLNQLGIVDEADVEQWLAALARVRAATDRRASRTTSPYRGLEPFEPEHAALFFGRVAETDRLVQLLGDLRDDPGPSNGMLAVIGVSGSGKSSLLRAGLVAALRGSAGGGGGAAWSSSVMTPGTDPLAALADAVAGLGDGARVLVVDQFEETFTSVADAATRGRFISALTDLAPHTLVVIGMRADFYAPATREPALLAALQHAHLLVGPLGDAELRQAIVGPARSVGASVDDGLVDVVLADLAPRDAGADGRDAGALPLLSHALLSTWEHASGNRLTLADYRASGGIEGAVQRSAEEVHVALDDEGRTVARRIFLRLVHLDDEIAVTRRRVSHDEIAALDPSDQHTAAEIVAHFVDRRLLTAGSTAVEISHEALLSAWPRLRGWIDDDRAGLRLHRQITDNANAWDAAARDDTLLMRGGRLEAAAEWAADPVHTGELNHLERAYLDAGVDAARAELERSRRRTRRLRQLLAAVAVLALVAAGLAGLSAVARSDADRAEGAASTARDDALSRQVAFQSRAVQANDPALAQQLAATAFAIAPTAESRAALIDQSTDATITRVLGAQGPTALAVSPDGRLVAVGHADDGTVHLYRLNGRRPPAPVATIPGDAKAQVFALRFTPDSRLLAVGGQSPRIRVWKVQDVAAPTRVATITTGFTGAVQSIASTPDGTTLAAGSAGPSPLREWRIAGPSPVLLPPRDGLARKAIVQSVAYSHDGTLLAAGGSTGILTVWPRTGAPRAVDAGGALAVNAVAFSPDDRLLYAGLGTGVVSVRRPVAGLPQVHSLPGASSAQVNVIAATDDGRQIAVGSSDNIVQQWDTSTWSVVSSIGNPGPVTGAAYTPDSRTLAATSADGGLRLWTASQRSITVDGGAFNLVYAAHRSRLAVFTSGQDGAARLWDTAGITRPRPVSAPIRLPASAGNMNGTGSLRADGTLLAAGAKSGLVGLWDVTDPAHPRLAGRPFAGSAKFPEGIAFSPNGRLLAVGADDHKISLWDVHDPARPRKLSSVSGGDLMLGVAFSPDGRLLAGANADKTAGLWDIGDPARPRLVTRLGGFANYVYGVTFSPDGTMIAATSSDHTSRVWKLHGTRRPTPVGRPLIGPTDYVYVAAFSPDSRTLAVGSNDHTVRLYDVSGGARIPIDTLNAQTSSVFSVVFTPDGRHLVAGGRDPALSIWTTDAASYAKELCPLVGDPITRDEWALYVPGAKYDPPCS